MEVNESIKSNLSLSLAGKLTRYYPVKVDGHFCSGWSGATAPLAADGISQKHPPYINPPIRAAGGHGFSDAGFTLTFSFTSRCCPNGHPFMYGGNMLEIAVCGKMFLTREAASCTHLPRGLFGYNVAQSDN